LLPNSVEHGEKFLHCKTGRGDRKKYFGDRNLFFRDLKTSFVEQGRNLFWEKLLDGGFKWKVRSPQ
jgi:hypothetical protein